MKITKITIITIIMMILSGCAGRAAWRLVDDKKSHYHSRNIGLSINLPTGWMMLEDKKSRSLIITRHSLPMSFIQITRRPLFEPLPNTALTVNAGMTPHEAAETAADNLKAAQGVFDLVIESLAPAQIGGNDGYEMMLSYRMENGMRRRCLIYGVIGADKYYTEIALYALEEYYFEASLEAFLEVVESVKG